MAQTRTSCPRCHQPVLVEMEQLFDVGTDPQAKQRILSGQINLIQCQSCGYQGPLAVPIVYHDAVKELLLTYFPPELGLPVTEQEKVIGPWIKKVVDSLPPEKRKAYLLRPQTMLTMQTMVEKILEGDGVTKEMLDAQQKRLQFLQRLLTASPETHKEIIRQEEALVDENLFNMINRLGQVSLSQGDQQSAQVLATIQKELIEETEFGKKIQAQAKEAEEAVKSLQEAGKNGLTREKLLDLIVNAKSDVALTTLVNMARAGMDYEFFTLLTKRVDDAQEPEKTRLTELRAKLIEMTTVIDKAIQAQVEQSRKVLEELLKAPNIEEVTQQNLDLVDDYFIEILRSELDAARQKGDFERSGKLQQIVNVIQAASAPPPEVEFINQLAEAENEEARQKLLTDNPDKVTQELTDMLANFVAQSDGHGQSEQVKKILESVYNSVLRFSMKKNLA